MLTAPQRDLVVEHAELGGKVTRGLRHDDRVGIANLAVVEAATRFDPAAGVSFATFAGDRARGAVRDRIRHESRVPRRHLSVLRLLDLSGQARFATDGDAASQCGLEVCAVADARAALDRAVILHYDQPLEPGAEDTLGDVAAATPDHAQRVVDRVALVEAVGRLTEQRRRVVVLRYFADWPVEAIARMSGVSGSAVSHTQRAALGDLRRQIEHVFD